MREVQHPEGHPWVKTSVVDEEAIDHERVVGMVAATGELISVRVAQRVDFDLLTDPVGVRTSPVRITVGGMFELSATQAAELAECLSEAVSRADALPGKDLRPKLVVEG
ncbi:hypothetical protein [Kineosporia babensis]|uniref:Uncharacterized protein n=1 Tax=Kineosporia babensis TaxID=499548 RepID=A0A9X1SUB4_9ACTN|nr:hypothetical protein [Kineosporia babensis]MCD5312729.1 hypothetical protein [Kineosporia babensis]